MNLRKFNYWLHSFLGVGCVVFLFLAGTTGAVLVFRDELDRAVEPPFAETGKPVSVDACMRGFAEALPGLQMRGIFLPTDHHNRTLVGRTANANLYGEAYANPETGEFLLYRDSPWRRWFMMAHYCIFLGDWGAALVFLPACGMVILGLSGIWVHRAAWKSLLHLPRFTRGMRLGLSDLHKATGVVSFVFCIVLGATGAFFNWNAVVRLVSGQSIAPWESYPNRGFHTPLYSLDAALQKSRNEIAGFEPRGIAFPTAARKIMTIYGSVPDEGPLIRGVNSVTLNSDTGEVLTKEDIRQTPWAKKWQWLVAPLHFGNFGGLPLKIIYCLASLSISVLSVAGVWIWLHRTRRKSPPHKS